MEVPLVSFRDLTSNTAGGDKSATIRERVVRARRTQRERFQRSSCPTNAAMSPRQVKQHCRIDAEATGYVQAHVVWDEVDR